MPEDDRVRGAEDAVNRQEDVHHVGEEPPEAPGAVAAPASERHEEDDASRPSPAAAAVTPVLADESANAAPALETEDADAMGPGAPTAHMSDTGSPALPPTETPVDGRADEAPVDGEVGWPARATSPTKDLDAPDMLTEGPDSVSDDLPRSASPSLEQAPVQQEGTPVPRSPETTGDKGPLASESVMPETQLEESRDQGATADAPTPAHDELADHETEGPQQGQAPAEAAASSEAASARVPLQDAQEAEGVVSDPSRPDTPAAPSPAADGGHLDKTLPSAAPVTAADAPEPVEHSSALPPLPDEHAFEARRESVAPGGSVRGSTERAPHHSVSSAKSLSAGSAVFVTSALESLASSKEARRSKPLKDSTATALEMVRAATTTSDGAVLDPRVVFESLRLACETKSVALQVTALDCTAKLVSYAFFADDEPTADVSLADLVVDTVCDCYEDQLDERVSVQIVKALLACVLSASLRVHQSSLLRAVRTVYNVYLLSKKPSHQAMAQGALSQMVSCVFGRVPRGTPHGASGDTSETASAEPVTLEMLERRQSLDQNDEATAPITAPDLLVKDAFLILRAMCKLSMKPLSAENERDLKSYAVRSKLLALQTVREALQAHMDVFTNDSVLIYSTTTGEQTTFIQAVKQYLCLCLSRNAVSNVLPVLEESCEVFWLVLLGMRNKMKKEIEVLMNEIYMPILEMRTSPVPQKLVLLGTLHRLCQHPQALVEMYLNYDCDRSALENLYERLMNVISRLAQTPPSEPAPMAEDKEAASLELRLKRESLHCLASVLHSLVEWMGRWDEPVPDGEPVADDDEHASMPVHVNASAALDDDPSRFESAKHRKTVLLEAIRTFNFKPKRGIQQLVEHGFIRSHEPQAIARFLFYADGLSKRSIGEYLGEGEPENIATMHAFVDMMEFRDMPLTTALRRFLQAFRLPGEAQKIDRYMLKFAERYTEGNKTAFANADTAYKLAYSVIMLNTDAHNPQVKHRMSLQDFIRNNAGLDDDRDLPEEYLRAIYDEIQKNEIKLHSEESPAAPLTAPGLAGAIATVGRDLQHEAYVMQTRGMASRTEVLFRTMLAAQQRTDAHRAMANRFFSASHTEHVKPMFEVAWMSFLAGISAPLQDSQDEALIGEALRGFQDAIKVVCFFGLELERNAFITTLAKFTFLNNLGEMKSKNVAAIKVLLELAHTEGNFLQGSWREVLTCVSQLERFQLISGGLDERMLPDLGRRPGHASRGPAQLPTNEVVQAGASTEITVAADRVFSSTPLLSGKAIVEFVQALCDVSWEEIQSSGMSDNPRLFSLQKVVEISYYNMGRIRMEWSRLWAILSEHFHQVCCHPNPAVSAFGLDSLRQLATKFFEKEELLHFSFQKDFLKPFEYTMRRNADLGAKEMVLQCLEQMIQARAERIRSGWSTMLGVLGVAANAPERIALYAFDLVRRVRADHLGAILSNGSYGDLCVCLAHFGKTANQRVSLPATALLRHIVATEPSDMSGHTVIDNETQREVIREDLWLPVLFALYDILMTGDDMEVRRGALDALFEILAEHGAAFTPAFWASVCNDVLFPIFNVLRNRSDVMRFSTQEDMSVWLSTTLIHALRQLVALWAHDFDVLRAHLGGLLELLCACICQENDTLARIGTACLQQLVVENVDRMDDTAWQQVTDAFLRLFRATTASQVFDPALSAPGDAVPANERRHAFKQIIVKCVLQLLLIETANELLRQAQVYEAMPATQLLRLTGALEDSYRFSRRFNADRELRTALWKVGFMKQLPNLLKQESTSASTLVYVYLRMQRDPRPAVAAQRDQVSGRFLPLAEEILAAYGPLDNETQARNIAAWTPVVAHVMDGLAALCDTPEPRSPAVAARTRTFYLLAVDLLDKIATAPALAPALRSYLCAVGSAHGLVDPAAAAARVSSHEPARWARDASASASQLDLRHLALHSASSEALSTPPPMAPDMAERSSYVEHT